MKKILITSLIFLLLPGITDARIFRIRVRSHVQSNQYTQPAPYTKAEIIPHEEEAWQRLTDEEKQFIAELDRLRTKLGLPQIIVVEQIVEDCRKWSGHLQKSGKFYHGNTHLENIAMGHEAGGQTFLQWRRSAGHNAKLCNRNDAYCGIGNVGKYWTYRAVPEMEHYDGTMYQIEE